MDAWLGYQLGEQNRQITGDPVTFRARFWSVVRCYPTAEGLVWFKETNPGHRYEASLTAAMARLAPDHIIVPIAVHPDRGWLLTNDHGPTLDHADVEDQPTRRVVVGELARLQCDLLGRMSAEEHPGLLLVAPARVGEQLRAVIREWAALPADHPLHARPELLDQVGRGDRSSSGIKITTRHRHRKPILHRTPRTTG